MKIKSTLILGAWISIISIISSCSQDPQDVISAENMMRIVKTVSSDDFLGRKPFTQGEQITVDFLAQELSNIGFDAPFEGSYFQKVPMIETTSEVIEKPVFTINGTDLYLNSPDEIAINSPQILANISVSKSQLVFCGFGIVAPEYGWNDFEGVDLHGKTAVVLINDPGFYTNDSTLFKGREMTYYGRWTYKYEEAAKQGADAILIIHEPMGAGYGYNVPRNSSIVSRLAIDGDNESKKCMVTGWLPENTAESILSRFGYKLEELRLSATKKGFKPIVLNGDFSAKIENRVVRNESTNVAGILRGKGNPEEAIVITAHWDHFGVGEVENGDSIFNGAVDNGTTIAWALEIGRAFSKLNKQMDRSIIILFPTAEEQGLVGSEYYTEHPIIPLNKTVACLNNDMMIPRGRMKDVTMIGYGYSSLDSIYRAVAERQERYLLPDPNSQTGLFFRSDHFPFFKKGVPSIWAMGCFDSREKGADWARESWDYYIKNTYHRPSDNYDPNWNWEGIVEDTKLAFEVVYMLSSKTKINPRLF